MAASGFGLRAQLSREQGIVGFGVAVIEIARGEKRQALCRRRQPGIMGWRGRDLSSLPRAALLES